MNKLAIVARANGFHRAPWNRPDYDCWTLNSAWSPDGLDRWWPKRLTAWFELHSRRYLDEEWHKTGVHFRALSLLRVPVYVQDAKAWPELERPTTFPRRRIAKAFPRGDYHASSIDWMLAFGVFQGYRDIHLWGVDLGPTEGREPLSARACLEYWVGFAEGRGVKVQVHKPTGLFWIYNLTRERMPYHYDDTWRLIEDRKS